MICEAEHPDWFDKLFYRQTKKLLKAYTELQVAWAKHCGFDDQEVEDSAREAANRCAQRLGMEPIFPAER